jgi:hypothetical protein
MEISFSVIEGLGLKVRVKLLHADRYVDTSRLKNET